MEFTSASAVTCPRALTDAKMVIILHQDVNWWPVVFMSTSFKTCPIALADANVLAFTNTIAQAFGLFASNGAFAKSRCALGESFISNQGSNDSLQPSVQCPL